MVILATMQRTRGVLRSEVLTICVVALLADIVSGIVMPTFSLYARSLGASLVFVGILTTLSGLTQLLSSVPIVLLSDRTGRYWVLLLGMLSFAAATTLFALAPNSYVLVPGRLALGVAMVATFWVAAAYMGDVTAGEERGVAFGLLTTAMGLGFAIGPLVGGMLAEVAGLRASYLFATGVALVGGGLVWSTRSRGVGAVAETDGRRALDLAGSLRLAGRSPYLLAGCVGNLLTNVAFAGAVATFFPVYGDSLGISEGAIGTMFALRAFVSTLARLPAGFLAAAVGSRTVMVGALALQVAAVLGMGWAEEGATLAVLLALEGVAFGAFLTAGHAFVAEHTVATTRGAAVGVYSSAGSIGGTIAPLGLGLVAKVWGLPAVFLVTGGVLVVGLAALGWLARRVRLAVDEPGRLAT